MELPFCGKWAYLSVGKRLTILWETDLSFCGKWTYLSVVNGLMLLWKSTYPLVENQLTHLSEWTYPSVENDQPVMADRSGMAISNWINLTLTTMPQRCVHFLTRVTIIKSHHATSSSQYSQKTNRLSDQLSAIMVNASQVRSTACTGG